MGRWGTRLFEGDTDLDMVYELEKETGIDFTDIGLHRTADMTEVEKARKKLDDGLSDKIYEKYRTANASESFIQPEYYVVIFTALIMSVGANITDENMAYIRSIFPKMESRSRYAGPLFDTNLRDDGKAQFSAALENYKPGISRNFYDTSCFHCGKIPADINKNKLSRCAKCQGAWYCDKDCQRADWKKHKGNCGNGERQTASGAFTMLNV